jgi:hypothetical protein
MVMIPAIGKRQKQIAKVAPIMRGTANNHSTDIEVSGGKAHQPSWFVQMFDHIVRVHKIELAEFQSLGVVTAGGLNDWERRKIAVSLLNLRRHRFETDIANAVLGESRAKRASPRANLQNRRRMKV